MGRIFIALLLLTQITVYSVDFISAQKHSKKNIRLAKYSGSVPTFGYGSSAAFDNPALLAHLYGHDINLSLNDITNLPAFTASYNGKLLEKSTFSVATSNFYKDGYNENTSVISFSSFESGLDFGVNSKFMTANRLWEKYYNPSTYTGGYNSTIFSLDFDFGFLYSIHNSFYCGLAMFNILSHSFVNNKEIKIFPERATKFHLGFSPDKERKLMLFAEGGLDSLHDLSLSHYYYGGGVQMSFFRLNNIQVRAGFHAETSPEYSEELRSVMAGCSFALPFLDNHISFEYSMRSRFSAGFSGTESGALSHFVLLGFKISGRKDYLPPIISIKVDNEYLTPNGDGQNEKLTFLISAEDNSGGSGIKKWALVIYKKHKDNKLEQLKSFSGSGTPPKAIEWNGYSSKNTILPAGTYFYELMAVDKMHNNIKSKIGTINISY